MDENVDRSEESGNKVEKCCHIPLGNNYCQICDAHAGVKDLNAPQWTLKQVAESVTRYPILLLLSPGADPRSDLELLASEQVARTELVEISLGHSQVPQAEAAIQRACKYEVQ